MKIDHYIVFIGANAALSTELGSMRSRIEGARIVAPAVKKRQIGATQPAISIAMEALVSELAKATSHSEPARLSLWFYDPDNADQFRNVWAAFGHSAWVESVPRSLMNKIGPTREFIENRINSIRPLLHEVSSAAYAKRKTSPLPLPLRNFTSPITTKLKTYWYNDLDAGSLSKKIKSFRMQFRQLRGETLDGYKDDKALIFKPAKDEECHGLAHPTGAVGKAFACGRFRYGVALFAGFHYDVRDAKKRPLQVDLETSFGTVRSLRSEKRTYINIFPNDHLLPEK